MSKTVDERVVRMQFDNAQFQKGVAESMSLLDKFKASLKFEGVKDGVEEVQKAANSVDLSPLAKAADSIEVHFSAMSVAAISAINTIVSAAVDAGMKITKSLTIDQVTAGFTKYTQKTSAVQTIMNATGKSVEEVNSALEKLQWFSDETSYSFVDMVSNVGKFTSAGVELNTAVSAMEGIALAAADAGSNTTEASRAMYNFAQALSKGFVQLIDWKSIENANMATVSLKEQLIQAALAAGTLEEVGDGMYQSLTTNAKGQTSEIFNATKGFNDSLNAQWLSNETLLSTLANYSAYADAVYEVSDAFDTCADAMEATSAEGMELGERAFKAGQQAKTFTEAIDATKDAVSSGWMETFEIIFGDFNESVELWTSFTNTLWDVFASGGEARNNLLRGGLMSGWNQFVNTGIVDVEKLKDIILDDMEASQAGFRDTVEEAGGFNESLKDGWLTADVLGRALGRVGLDLSEYSDAELEAMGYTKQGIEAFKSLREQVADGSVDLKEFAELMARPSGRENLIDGISNAFTALQNIVTPVKAAFSELFPAPTVEQIYNATVKFKEFTENLKISEEAMGGLQKVSTVLLTPLKAVADLAGKAGKALGGFVLEVVKAVDSALTWVNQFDSFGDVFNKILGNERYTKALEAWDTIASKVSEAFNKVKEAIFGTSDGTEIGAMATDKINKSFEWLEKTLGEFKEGALDAVVNGLEKLSQVDLTSFTEMLTSGIKTIKEYTVDAGKFVNDIYLKVKEFLTSNIEESDFNIWDAIGEKLKNFSSTVKEFFTTFSFDDLFASFEANNPKLIAGFKKLGDAIVDFASKITPGQVAAVAFSAAVIGMMVTAMKVMDSVADLAESAAGVLGGLKGLIKSVETQATAVKWTTMAAGVAILAGALTAVASIDPDRLWSSVGALGALAGGMTAIIVVFAGLSKVVSSSKEVTTAFQQVVLSAIAIAASVTALAGSLKILSTIDSGALWEGVAAILVSFVSMAASLRILATDKSISLGIGSAISIAVMLGTLVMSLKSLAEMQDTGALINGIIGLQAVILALGEIAVVSRIAGKASTFGSMMGMVVGLLAVNAELKKLADDDPADLLTALLNFQAIFAALLEIAVVSRVAGKAGATTMLGVSAMLISMNLVVAGLGELDESTLKQGLTAVAVLSAIIVAMVGLMKTTDKDSKVVGRAGTTLMAMSISMAALMLVVDFLGNLDTDVLVKGTASVTVIGLMLTALIAATKDAGKASKNIIAMGVVLAAATAAIVGLTFIDWQKTALAATELSAIMLSLSLVLKNAGNMNFASSASSILAMVGIFVPITLALKSLAEANTDWQRVITSAAALSACLLAVSAALKVMSTADFKDSNLATLAASAGLLMVAIAEITGALLLLGNYGGDWQNMIVGAGSLSLAVLALAESVKIMSEADIKDAKLAKLTRSAIAVGAFAAEITGALLLLSNFGGSWDSMIASAGSLSLAVLAMAEAVNIMSESKINDTKVKNLTKISGTMAIFVTEITASLLLLSNFGGDWQSMISSAASLSLTLDAMAVAIRIMGEIDVGSVTQALTAAGVMAIIMTTVTAAFIALDKFDATASLQNAASLSLVINAVALATNLLNGINFTEGAGVALAMSAMLLSIAQVLKTMAEIPPVDNLANVGSLSLAMLAIAGLMETFNLVKTNIANVAAGGISFAGITLMLAGLAELIGFILSNDALSSNFDKGIEAIAKLQTILPIFTGLEVFIAAVSAFHLKATTMLSAAAGIGGSFAIISGIVLAVVEGIGAILSIPGAEDMLDKGLSFFTKLAGTLGEMIGAFAGGVAVGLTDSLGQLGANIAAFAENIKPAIEALGTDDAGKLADNLTTLSKALLAITGGELLDSISGGDSMENFGSQLSELVGPLGDFFTSLDGLEIDPAKLDTVMSAVEKLGTFSGELKRTGGLVQGVIGEVQSVADFAKDLMGGDDGVPLFDAMKEISDTLGTFDFNTDKFQTVMTAVEQLGEFSQSLKRVGGFFQEVFGEVQDISDFIDDILGNGGDGTGSGTGLFDGMKQISDLLGTFDFNTDKFETVMKAVEQLGEFSQSLKRVGGYFQDVFGTIQDVSDFIDDILGNGGDGTGSGTGLFDGMKQISDTLATFEFDSTKFGEVMTAIEQLGAFSTSLKTQGGLFQDIAGTVQSITDFINDVVGKGNGENGGSYGLADGIVAFMNTLSGVEFDATKVDAAIEVAEKIKEFAQKLDDEKTFWDKMFGGNDFSLSTYATEMKSFAESYGTFAESMAAIDPVLVSTAVDAVKKLFGMFGEIGIPNTPELSEWNTRLKTIATDGIQAFVDAFSKEDVDAPAKNAVTSFIKGITDQLTGQDMDFSTAAHSLMTKISNTFTGELTEAANIGTTIASGIRAKIEGMTVDVAPVARNLVASFASTISSGAGMITNAANTAFGGFLPALKSKVGAEPPVTQSIATNLINGFVNTLNSGAASVSASATALGNAVVTGVTSGITASMPAVLSTVSSVGASIPAALGTAITLGSSALQIAAASLGNAISDAIKTELAADKFVKVGQQICEGLAKGIRAGQGTVTSAVKNVAKAATNAAKVTLDEHSPSRVFNDIGLMADAGLAQGFEAGARDVTTSISGVASQAVGTLSGALQTMYGDMTLDSADFASDMLHQAIEAATALVENTNTQPVITPVLDLSEVKDGMATLSLNDMPVKASVTERRFTQARKSKNEIQNGSNSSPDQSTTYNFYQTNTSPKALNSSEVYRQTRNLLSQLRNK